jgi:transposase
MSTNTFFGDLGESRGPRQKSSDAAGTPRVILPNRTQGRLQQLRVDDLIPSNHRARVVWSVVEGLDLSSFYAGIRARGAHAGRPAIDPKTLFGLWLYATMEGVGSARQLARLCLEHAAYRWIVGDEPINAHTLSDFRVQHEEKLDELLTKMLVTMRQVGLLKGERVAQDGTRMRAHAGAASFRRGRSMRKLLTQAKAEVLRLKGLRDSDDPTTETRKIAAKERAAREHQKRLEQALKTLEEIEIVDKEDKERRVSTTDPEARVMKMADGGFRPAYNAQIAVDTRTGLIVDLRTTNSGSDMGEADETLERVERRLGVTPKEYLMDGGFAKKASIETMEAKGIDVYAPTAKVRRGERTQHVPRADDSAAIAAWRVRMGTSKAKDIYKERAPSIERVNADLKAWRGLARVNVLGIRKVNAVLLWGALCFNLMRCIELTQHAV